LNAFDTSAQNSSNVFYQQQAAGQTAAIGYVTAYGMFRHASKQALSV
jgi:hypothetical protein